MRRAPLLLPAFLACSALALIHPHATTLERERPTARYSGVAIGDVRDTDDGRSATTLALESVGVVRATLDRAVEPGERIVVRGRLEPFDEPRNPGEPSMREIEGDDGIVGRLAAARVLARDGVDRWDLRAWPARLRAVASQRIRAVIPEPSATILAGALWGERGTLPDDLHDAFQATGTVHVLVTAGLHLGIVAALIALLLGAFGLHRTTTCAVAFTLILAYAGLTGAHLPVLRATAMLGVALLARACGARVTSWNALAFAALVIAVLWPTSVASASFAMSFSCVAAIVLFADPFAAALARVPLPHRLREAVALTCATQIGTWPLTAAIFSTLAPYAVVANAIVVPLVAVVLPLGIATLALPALAPLTTMVLLVIEATVRTIAALPLAHATMATPPVAAIAGYDLLCVAGAILLRRSRVRLACGAIALAFVCVLMTSWVHPRHGLTITHLDVGQGDAAVIRTPTGRTILIDTGGELEHGSGTVSSAERAGARIVLGYLRRQGITRIDLMILTHPHGDHVGAAAPIINAMPVGMIFDSGQSYSGRAYRDAMAAAHSHGVPVVLARREMRWTSGDGVTLDVLAPSMPFLADTGDDVNENSIVIMLHAGSFRELFMGDAGEASEARLLAPCHPEQRRGAAEDKTVGGPSTEPVPSGVEGLGVTACENDLHADVIKVGHHGSRYASTAGFVAAVHPNIAVVSVGRHNTFGHPALATIEAWSATGARILRTDRCGAVSLAGGSAMTMVRCTAEAAPATVLSRR
jgi:competence protein ComEC